MVYGNLDDQQLVNLLTNGNEDAFTEIFDRYWKRLIALAYTYTKDKFLAEEIVQEVFVSLWKRRGAVTINSLSAYLATSVKFSVFKQAVSTDRRARIVGEIPVASFSEITEETINARFLQEYVDGIVEQMPERCRQVYIYSRHEGLSVREISKEMAITEKTVENHLTRALKILKLNLKILILFL